MSMRIRVFLIIVVGAALLAAVGSSRIVLGEPAPAALKKQAKAYVDAAQAAEVAGDYDTAISLYTKAYGLIPHPILLFNQGQDSRLAGRRAEATTYYERFLATHPAGDEAAVAREWLGVFQRELAEEARKADEARKAEEVHKAEEARNAEAARNAKVAQAEGARVEVATSPNPGARHTRRMVAYALGGAGVVATGVGLWFGVRARSSWNDAHSDGHCDTANVCDERGLALIDDAQGNAHRANVLIAVSAAMVVAGAVVFLTAPAERTAASSTVIRAQPMLSPSAAGLAITGAF